MENLTIIIIIVGKFNTPLVSMDMLSAPANIS